MIKKALNDDNNVLDRSIYEDALFTRENNAEGNISDTELEVYLKLLDNMMADLKQLPKRAPRSNGLLRNGLRNHPLSD